MTDMPKWIREAFDGESVPKKNIALRRAYNEILRLQEALGVAELGLNAAINQFSISHIALEKVRSAINSKSDAPLSR